MRFLHSLVGLNLLTVLLVTVAALIEGKVERDGVMGRIRLKRNPGGEFISPDGVVQVSWLFNSSDFIRWEVTAAVDGWVGIGFSYEPTMAETDFVLGFVSQSVFSVTDRFTSSAGGGTSLPSLDTDLGGTDDLVDPAGQLENGVISFSFGRKVNTTDKFDKVIIKDEMFLLYAYGKVNSGIPSYHQQNRRAFSLNFYPTFEFTSPDGIWKASWSFSDNLDVVSFELVSKYNGWLGIGISETGVMQSSDFIVAWYNDTNSIAEATDRVADPTSENGHALPSLDIDLGGVNDIFNVSGSKAEIGGVITTTISFNRKCVTGDPFDVSITNRNIYLLFAYGDLVDGIPIYHGPNSRGSAAINFQFGIQQPSDSSVNFYVVHGSLMALCWSILVTPMAIFARYYKLSFRQWFRMHWMLNTLALILISVAFILVLLEMGTIGKSGHAIIGLMVLILAIIQGIIGQASNRAWFEGKIPAFWPDKVHWYLGRVIIILSIVNIILGLQQFGADSIPYGLYGAFVGLTLLLIAFLEIRVGQTSEFERINDGKVPSEAPLGIFWIYWGTSAILISVALGFNFTN